MMWTEPNPAVSVIVPSYNHARYLRERVESILGQTYQDFELILLDDCSMDESREILRSYASDPRVRMEFNEENSGTPFAQWNKGVRMARGKYVWIAESDDYADPGFLQRMVPLLEADAGVSFAYCRSRSVGASDEPLGFADAYLEGVDHQHWKQDFVSDGAEECRRFFVHDNPVPNASAAVFRRAAYDKVGGADEGLRLCGDYKLWAAMALEGQISYTAEPLNYHRTHAGSVRARARTDWIDYAEGFYVKRWIVTRIALQGTRVTNQDSWTGERTPAAMAPHERVRYAIESVSLLAPYFPVGEARKRLAECELILREAEFELSPPGRLRFLVHKCKFYAFYFPVMSWKLRATSLLRVAAASVLGYRHRHDPEQLYTRVVRLMGAVRQR